MQPGAAAYASALSQLLGMQEEVLADLPPDLCAQFTAGEAGAIFRDAVLDPEHAHRAWMLAYVLERDKKETP